ncbi:MAG: ferrous iron transport protein A [Gammaproteobacteria bacterium]|nr:ferrous iron transport protein A [Gammaproteobacteria bacterium]
MDDRATPLEADAPAFAEMALADLQPGITARVVGVCSGPHAPIEVAQRLAELGFLPGEIVRVVARGFLSREPIAVRVGTGTFALRRFEADCVRVVPAPGARVII